MSVDYTAILGVGKIFDDADEAIDWIKKNYKHEYTAEMVDGFDLDALEAMFKDNGADLSIHTLNAYISYSQVALYFSISVHDTISITAQFDTAFEEWYNLFGQDANIIHTVCIS